MRYLFYITGIILALSLSLPSKAQEEKKNKLLIELAKVSHDSTRLNILHDLTVATKYNPQIRLYYIDQMFKEAVRQKNDYYICRAYLYRIIIAFNKYDISAVNYWYSLLEPIALKNNEYDLLFLGKRCTIDILQITGEYEKEESESLKLLKDAEKVNSTDGLMVGNQSLGNAYYITYRYKEAFIVFEKAYQYSMKLDNPAMTLEIINSLITVSESMGDKANWLKYIRLEEECINRSIKEDKVNYGLESSLFIMYIHYVAFYIKFGNIEEAGRYYKLAEESFYASKESGIYQEYFLRIGSNYLFVTKQYDKALAYSDTLLTLVQSVSAYSYNRVLASHAEILLAMGRDEEALHNFKIAKSGLDSSYVQILNTQTEQVRSLHNLNLLELEKKKNRQYLQLTILIFLVLSILTIIGFIIYTYRSRKKLKRDEVEMRQMTDEVELANQAKERFLSNISTSISAPLSMVVESSLLLASRQEIDEDQRIVISEKINKTSAELMQLINDILDLSRLEAGMMRFIVSDVEVFSLMSDAAASIEQGRGINIVCPQLSLFWSHIDGTRLLNVFNNLFSSVLPDKELQVLVEVNKEETELMIKVYGTSLAGSDLPQNQIIKNEINRMVINHFGGNYESLADIHSPYVYFTINGRFTSLE